jgi:uncharacterized protein (UPF0212 family)
MKPIILLLAFALFVGCTSSKKEQLDSVAQAADTAVVNLNLNPALATTPLFRNYSTQILTDDERESAIIASLDSLFAIYLKQKYFSIASESSEKKSWHFDENKQLRIITTERENETVKENSIYLFNAGNLIASYSDVDADGMDTQRKRERIAVNKCPDCGIRFDSQMLTVEALDEARVKDLATFFNDEYNSVRAWIGQAPIRTIVGNNCVFERGSPNNTRYTVNKELYSKFIKK